MFIKATFTTVLCCLLVPLGSARITKPSSSSHGAPKYQAYELQQNYQSGPQYQHQQELPVFDYQPAQPVLQQQVHQPIQHHKQTATKHSSGSHYSHSGQTDEEDHHDYHSHPKYKYSYKVEEPKTGDFKQHSEERDGDVVHGEYSLIEADGSLRTIKYTVDKEHGFQAIVIKDDGSNNKKHHN